MMKCTISNKITVENANDAVIQWCMKNLEFPNPEYAKREQSGRWLGDIPARIVLWERRGNDVIIPYGCERKFRESFFTTVEVQLGTTEERIEYGSNIELYDYQKEAVENCLLKSGVLVMPCGSGKTQTALQIAATYGRRTLWLTHTQDLLKQSMNRAKNSFSLPEDAYGTITAGKINVGKVLTFATVQTMSRIELEDYKNYWDVIIVDECHKAVGTPTNLMMFYKVISALAAPIKLGLTATPKRNDSLERCMYALLGDVLWTVTEDEVADKNVPIYIRREESPFYEPHMDRILDTDGTLNYNKFLDDLCRHYGRNWHIANTVGLMNGLGKTCLVLSDRVEHLRFLRELVGTNYTEQIEAISQTKTARDKREAILDQLRKKQLRCVFATYQLAKEGLDIPSLDCVIFATPKKDMVAVEQSAGRVKRKAEGKEYGIVYDFVDVNFPMLNHWYDKRKNLYKRKGWKIF